MSLDRQHKKSRVIRTRHVFLQSIPIFIALIVTVLSDVALAITPISQGYSTTDSLSVGSIVSLEDGSYDNVAGSTTSNSDAIVGVVINDGTSLIQFANSQGNEVQVATSGTVSVLVSDINGDVEKGDHITASPIKGVGMKATSNTKVIGIAQDNLSGSSGSQQQEYTDSEGVTHPILLGEVSILINVSYYYKEPEKTLIPSAVQKIANAIAGKTVNTLPIIISLVIFVTTLIVVVSIIYSMIRSSIISVGRNPMSQSAIYRDVVQLSVLVIGILTAAVIAIYVILTRL